MGRKSQYNRKDRLYQQAKDEGLRSRAAYRIEEINNKFGILRPGSKVVELGAWPGGWLQVISRSVGAGGLVVGVDLTAFDSGLPANVTTIQGDAGDDAVLTGLRELAPDGFDSVLSDMSPKLSGIKELDRMAAIGCAELALFVAGKVLRRGGAFVCKVFKSNEAEEFFRASRAHFERLVRTELDSTRKSSNEFYIVGLGFNGDINGHADSKN